MKKFIWAALILVGCETTEQANKEIDIQGHRGARGLAPENTIPAFLRAVELGVKTIELDLVISKDKQLVVSHEPYFSPVFCLDKAGKHLPEDSIINMYKLTYDEIKTFDCGSKGNPRFPDQELVPISKPLLSEAIDEIEFYAEYIDREPLLYNIELKTQEKTDSIFHPSPEEFSDLVYELISEKEIWDRVNIQSFDFRTLQYFKKRYPAVRLALLIENELPWRENVDSLGFTPDIYSCYYPLLTEDIITQLHTESMLVIPWTINEQEEMKKLKRWGVDGIITDYPDRAMLLK